VGTVSVLADISAVLVILEFMVLAVVPLAVLYFACRGVRWLNTHLRVWLRQVQTGVNKVRGTVKRGAGLVAKPFVTGSVFFARLQGLCRGVGKALSGKP